MSINLSTVTLLLITPPLILLNPNNKQPEVSLLLFPLCILIPSNPFTSLIKGNFFLNLGLYVIVILYVP